MEREDPHAVPGRGFRSFQPCKIWPAWKCRWDSGLWAYHEHALSNRRIRLVAADADWHQADCLMRALLKLNRTALLVLSVVWLSSYCVRAQQPIRPIRVLVLYWDEKDYPTNVDFERRFQSALRSAAPGPVEFYSEFLESSRF